MCIFPKWTYLGIKYRIMQELDRHQYCMYSDLEDIVLPEKTEKYRDKFVVAFDWLLNDEYIDFEVESLVHDFKVTKHREASAKRYFHDFNMAVLDRCVQIGSFLAIIVTLLVTAA